MIAYPTDPKSVIFAKAYGVGIAKVLYHFAGETHSDIVLPATFDLEKVWGGSYTHALSRANLVVLDHMPHGYLVIKNRYTGQVNYLMSQEEFDDVTKHNVNREYYAEVEEAVQTERR